MMSEGNAVSIIIPTYNEGRWLYRTVESVLSTPSELAFEIVVVDDGCTDGSIDAVSHLPFVRVVRTGGEQVGPAVGRNVGAAASAGRYLCFIDSHVLVQSHWLDYLRQCCDAYPNGALVSGNLPDVDSDINAWNIPYCQHSYTIGDLQLHTAWHLYSTSPGNRPYMAPLTPGGLMFTQKAHFVYLGGFDNVLRKWGAEDVQISLQNYYMGGANVVDPRVFAFHYYKCSGTRPQTFNVSTKEYAFNCLYVAATYFPPSYYLRVKKALAWKGRRSAEQIESTQMQGHIQALRRRFVRSFDQWLSEFAVELRALSSDIDGPCTEGLSAPAMDAAHIS